MVADIETVVLPEIKRLANKPKWPAYEEDAQLELARVAQKYARDLTHLRDIIADISERWDHCPDGRELREALVGQPAPVFEGRTKCPLEMCDGSGWVQVYALQTRENSPGGTTFTRKESLTAAQHKQLRKQGIDPQKQELYEGVKRCDCKPKYATTTAQANEIHRGGK